MPLPPGSNNHGHRSMTFIPNKVQPARRSPVTLRDVGFWAVAALSSVFVWHVLQMMPAAFLPSTLQVVASAVGVLASVVWSGWADDAGPLLYGPLLTAMVVSAL